MTDWIIKPSGDLDLSNAWLVPDTGLPQQIDGVEAGHWDVGRVDWNTSNPVEVYPDDSNIRGTWPVLASLANGDTLSAKVAWGSYTSTSGAVTTTQEMRKGGGSWTAYVGNTTVAAGETWQVREIADDGDSTRTFESNVETAPAVVPAAPAVPTQVSVTDSGFSVDWTAPADGGSPITGYRLYVDAMLYSSPGSGPATVTGRAASTQYSVTVAAVNAVGEGPQSPALLVTTSAAAVPVISSVVFDDEADPPELTFDVSSAGSLYAQWTEDDTPLLAAAVKSGADETKQVAVGINYLDFGDPEEPGTYWLQFVVEGAGGFSNVAVVGPVEVESPEVGLFSETWSDWATGKTQGDLLAGGWTAGLDEGVGAIVSADVEAPDGKSLKLSRQSGSNSVLTRDDISAALSAGDWTTADVVALVRIPNTTFAKAAFGFYREDDDRLDVAALGWGAAKVIVRTNAMNMDDTTSPAMAVLTLTGLEYSDLVWVRIRLHDSDQISAKLWQGARGDEPVAWGGTKTGRTWADAGLRLGVNVLDKAVGSAAVLGFWVGIDRDAEVPSW